MNYKVRITLLFFVFLLGCKSQAVPKTEDFQKRSLAKFMLSNENASGQQLVQLYSELKNKRYEEFNFDNENELNQVGYALLGKDRS